MDQRSIPNSAPFTITTPLYYVNDLPHIGSAYTTIGADIVARFQRLRGREVLLVTGTDEHGQKIQRTAEGRHQTPQAHCDQIAAGYQSLWEKLDIQWDRFVRTTSPSHAQIVAEFFQRVWDQGDIYQGRQQGWYCVACEEFKEEKDLDESHGCAIHPNLTCEWRDEINYFFRLSRYQTKLEAWYDEHPDFIQPVSRRNEVLSFVSQGLEDFSISRVDLPWGIPVPADLDQTLYVWFDALLGYISALVEPGQPPTLDNALNHWWPINLHLIGKDILRFHAVYWPAMLLSAGLSLPRCVFGHGFLTKDGRKMGKSLGNTLDPLALVERHGSEALRYYFAKEIDWGRDGDFSETRFVQIVNADLANDLGNLLNRTLKMVHKYCAGAVPDPGALADTHPLKSLGTALTPDIEAAYEALDFSGACTSVLNLVRAGNQFIDSRAPWSLYKQGDQAGVAEVLYTVLESVRLGAYWLSPVIPRTSSDIYRQLGYPMGLNSPSGAQVRPLLAGHESWGILDPGRLVLEPYPVFCRLELQSA